MPPSVTCVITAHNHADFIAAAVRSALAQDYPADLLDVVVVNDGSTDGTDAVLDRAFGAEPRVTLIHQENRGFVGAMNRALLAATGELIGILDGDDTWPADRIARQAAVMEARPEVGLVHGDMDIVDAEGRQLHPSFFAYSRYEVPRGRILGKLLAQNVVAGGASLVRASLRDRFCPIPEELMYPDWHIAARVAEVAEIDHVDGVVNHYRSHGANMGLGGTGAKFFVDMRHNVRIIRWMLRQLDLASVSASDLVTAAQIMLGNATRAAVELGGWAADVLPVCGADRDAAGDARAVALEADRSGDARAALEARVRALAADPWDGAAHADLVIAGARAERGPGDVRAPETRGAAVLAFADELAATPELLAAYAGALSDADDVTLIVRAGAADAEQAAATLGAQAEATGLTAPGGADVLLLPCDDDGPLLAAPVRAVYSRRRPSAAFASLPRFDDTSVRALAEAI